MFNEMGKEVTGKPYHSVLANSAGAAVGHRRYSFAPRVNAYYERKNRVRTIPIDKGFMTFAPNEHGHVLKASRGAVGETDTYATEGIRGGARAQNDVAIEGKRLGML